ncbi:MAG: hypothetical protein HY646_06045 [Acidobacteria bacterium]|nr:hypothetical protein [Acidobacteriota bacterium]
MTREIIVVEDQKAQAYELCELLERKEGLKPPEYTFIIWHITSASDYAERIAEAEQCSAKVMIADLRLVDPGHTETITHARNYADRKNIGVANSDPMFWNWEDSKRNVLLPGAVLVEAFVRGGPGQKHVLIMSDYGKSAKRWYLSLPTCVEDLGGRMGQEDGSSDAAFFIRRAFEDWPAILWSQRTSGWFKGFDHNPAPRHIEGQRIVAEEQKLRLWNWTRALFDFEPPTVWFDDFEQFGNYFETLKGLTGACSCTNGDGAYNVYLASMPILVALAMREQKVPKNAASRVLENVRFDADRFPLLPSGQKPHAAQQSVKEIVNVIASDFVWHRSDRTRRVLLGVEVAGSSVSLLLDFPATALSPGRQLNFVEKVRNTVEDRAPVHEGLRRLKAQIVPKITFEASAQTHERTRLIFRRDKAEGQTTSI